MRLRNIPGAEKVIEESGYTIMEPERQKGKWSEIFGNSNEIRIEIGMGKGRFLVNQAKQNPKINFIGIEKYSSVMLRAVQKLALLEDKITNLFLICMDAEDLENVFKKDEIGKIYLNFSDPWPKERHARRRLPSKEFLARYDMILQKEGRLEFKTDNRLLFDFAVEQAKEAGWQTEQISYDLHNDKKMKQGNIMTEYEEKFSSAGHPIYKHIIYR